MKTILLLEMWSDSFQFRYIGKGFFLKKKIKKKGYQYLLMAIWRWGYLLTTHLCKLTSCITNSAISLCISLRLKMLSPYASPYDWRWSSLLTVEDGAISLRLKMLSPYGWKWSSLLTTEDSISLGAISLRLKMLSS